MVAVQTLLETFLGISLTSVCFIDEAFFLVKSKIFGLMNTLPQVGLEEVCFVVVVVAVAVAAAAVAVAAAVVVDVRI
jgi:hypothetical protein